MRILLIEDDPQFVRHVEMVANSMNVDFVACMTGREGLRRVSKGDIDVAIVDGVLPDKQGPRVIEDIKSLRPRIAPKIVFLSAFFNDVRTFRKLTALGVDLVLSKPITATDLKAQLEKVLPEEPEADTEQDSAQEAFKAAMARLKDDYIEKLKQFWAPKLERLIERAADDELGVVDEIKHVCHKLRGSGGSYGQEHISQAAARLEDGVNRQALARLLPEMRSFLRMLETAGEAQAVPELTMQGAERFRGAVVVTESPLIFKRVAAELAEDDLPLVRAGSVHEALQAAVTAWPDLFIVDAAAMDDDLEISVITSLHRRGLGVPILAFGTPYEDLPERCIGVPPTARRSLLLQALEQPELQPFSDCSMFVCDEHPSVAKTVTKIFKPLGVTITAITRPEDYLPRLRELSPSMVLMDVAFGSRQEGETVGMDLVREAIADEQIAPMATVFLSGNTTLKERDDAYDLGVAYVLKPLSDKQLLAEVTRVFRKERFTKFAQLHLSRDTSAYRQF